MVTPEANWLFLIRPAPISCKKRLMPKQCPPDSWTICSMICHFAYAIGSGIGSAIVQSPNGQQGFVERNISSSPTRSEISR